MIHEINPKGVTIKVLKVVMKLLVKIYGGSYVMTFKNKQESQKLELPKAEGFFNKH